MLVKKLFVNKSTMPVIENVPSKTADVRFRLSWRTAWRWLFRKMQLKQVASNPGPGEFTFTSDGTLTFSNIDASKPVVITYTNPGPLTSNLPYTLP